MLVSQKFAHRVQVCVWAVCFVGGLRVFVKLVGCIWFMQLSVGRPTSTQALCVCCARNRRRFCRHGITGSSCHHVLYCIVYYILYTIYVCGIGDAVAFAILEPDRVCWVLPLLCVPLRRCCCLPLLLLRGCKAHTTSLKSVRREWCVAQR